MFALIENERQSQDAYFNPDDVKANGLTRRQEHLTAPAHLAQINAYSRKAEEDWVWDYKRYGSEENGKIEYIRGIAKIAAICVRALEEMDGTEKLLTAGLRDTPYIAP